MTQKKWKSSVEIIIIDRILKHADMTISPLFVLQFIEIDLFGKLDKEWEELGLMCQLYTIQQALTCLVRKKQLRSFVKSGIRYYVQTCKDNANSVV